MTSFGESRLSRDFTQAEAEAIERFTAKDIDVQYLNEYLAHVNPFGKRKHSDKLPPILMYEITSRKESTYKSMTLRELLSYIEAETTRIDKDMQRNSFPAHLSRHASKKHKSHQPSPAPGGIPRPRSIASSLGALGQAPLPPAPTDPTSPNVAPTAEETYSAISDLRLRDLRRLDFQFNPNEEKSILIRRHVILFAMDPIRAVVMADKLILIVPDGADSLISILDKYMKEWVPPPSEIQLPLTQSVIELHKRSISADSIVKPLPSKEKPTFAAPKPSESAYINSPKSKETERGSVGSGISSEDIKKNALTYEPPTFPPPTQALPSDKSDSGDLSGVHLLTKSNFPRSHQSDRISNNIELNDNIKKSISPKNKQQTVVHMEEEIEEYLMPFESHAYEALLTTVKSLESQEYSRVNEGVKGVLQFLKTGFLLPIEVQERIRTLKNELSLRRNHIVGGRDLLEELTDDDEEMALMNLSYLAKKPTLYNFPLVPEILTTHDEIEELLESYLIDFNSLEAKMELLRSQIQTAEELVSLRLDTSRNQLLIANTALAVLACSFGFGSYIAGLFGMNLNNTEDFGDVSGLFTVVCLGSFALICCLVSGILFYLRTTEMIPGTLVVSKDDQMKLLHNY